MRSRPTTLCNSCPKQYFVELLARVAAAAAQDGPPLVDLGRGNPEIGPPPHVVEALRRGGARRQCHGYAPIRGLPRCARRSPRATRATTASSSTPTREVAVVPGTKTALVELAVVLAERGDTSLLPDPYYPDYPSGRRARRARRSRRVAARPGRGLGARPRRGAAAAAALPELPVEPLRGLRAGRRLRRRGRLGAADGRRRRARRRVHRSRLRRTPARRASSHAPGAKDVGVELWSMSKTTGWPGWRIGFVVGNAEIVERINLMNDHARVGIFAPLQAATIAALDGPQDSVAERVAAYERRRDVLAAALPGRRSRKGRSSSGCDCPRA